MNHLFHSSMLALVNRSKGKEVVGVVRRSYSVYGCNSSSASKKMGRALISCYSSFVYYIKFLSIKPLGFRSRLYRICQGLFYAKL